MLRIKRLYSFILQTFIPVFLMTSTICLFIYLMQFLWKYVEDFVGKGLDPLVIGELFFYAALNLIPMSLPLGILLASLISFGNMGERLELLAVKAAGISLFKTMLPLIIFISAVSMGSFVFQNNISPKINIKLQSLYLSIRQASPALDIPEGSFYGGITNYSIFVKKKNPETNMLYDMIAYDTSEGFDNMSVFVCDSAQMSVPDTKDHILLVLHSGQRFANFREGSLTGNSPRDNKYVPYGRENFGTKKIIIPFNSDFTRMDESRFENSQAGKNVSELNRAIDSMRCEIDSLNKTDRKIIFEQVYKTNEYQYIAGYDSLTAVKWGSQRIDIDSILLYTESSKLSNIYSAAISTAEVNKSKYLFESVSKTEALYRIRRHEIEWHSKFSLSFACLIFFFVGAPLGAIIRKGGLGLPVVISVLLFIVYYIMYNFGYKMARDGVWEIWQGVWLSSFILFPLGVFLTYKAMNDSALFNGEAYNGALRKVLQIPTKIKSVRQLEVIDITTQPSLSELSNPDKDIAEKLRRSDVATLKRVVREFIQNKSKYSQESKIGLSILKEKGSQSIDYTAVYYDKTEIMKCRTEYNKNAKYLTIIWAILLGVLIVCLTLKSGILKWTLSASVMSCIASYSSYFNWALLLSAIAYLTMYIRGIIMYSDFLKNIGAQVEGMRNKTKVFFKSLSHLLVAPIGIWTRKKRMEKELDDVNW